VVRPAQVRVEWLDENGDRHEELFDGLDSHCVQHEIDHLDGVLFIDYLSALKRNMILRKMKKYNKDAAAL
jgi:peptide deformylase